MEVYIEIIAMDRESGVKKTIKETVQVPRGVLALHEIIHGSEPGERVKAIALSLFMGAKKELDPSRNNKGQAMTQMVEQGGRVGGNQAAAPAAPGAAAAPAKANPMAEALGLDMIRHMAVKEGHAAQHAPAPQLPPQSAQQAGPPIAGFRR